MSVCANVHLHIQVHIH